MEDSGEAIERVLVESKAPYTLEELLRELKEHNPDLDVSSVAPALDNSLKTERIKRQEFNNVSLTLYFDQQSVYDVTCDVKQSGIQNEPVTPTSSAGSRVARLYPRRPVQLSGRVRMPFHSPARQLRGVVAHHGLVVKNVQEEVDRLRSKREELDGEISLLSEEYSEDELKEHIDMLHQYNEIKDTGQMLLGKLAELKGTTTKVMYEEFGLSLDD